VRLSPGSLAKPVVVGLRREKNGERKEKKRKKSNYWEHLPVKQSPRGGWTASCRGRQ